MKLTIAERADMFRAAAEMTESAAAARMYLDTANVLLTLAHQYHALSVAVREAYTRRDQRPNKRDAAWECIGAILQAQQGWEAATTPALPAGPRAPIGGRRHDKLGGRGRRTEDKAESGKQKAETGAAEGGAE